MENEIPFYDVATEIKPLISGIDVSLELDNIKSSIKKAKSDIVDVVGEDIWNIMINHYNDSEHYNKEDETNEYYIRLNNLVKYIQDPLIHFGLYRHFIWMILRISNKGITVSKNDNETTAYKYLTDEAKGELISTAWEGINTLIGFLNTNATKYTPWAAATDYVADQIVIYNDVYYKAKVNFTSAAAFNALDWTVVPKSITFTDFQPTTDYLINQIVRYNNVYYSAKAEFISGEAFDALDWNVVAEPSEIIFWQWTESEQFTDSKSLIFDDYKDFEKYFGIDKSAYFLIKARYIINELIEDDINPRIETLETLKQQLQYNTVSTDNIITLKKIKRYLAYKTISIACFRFDFHELPRSIRFEIDNEIKKSEKNPDFIKEKVSVSIDRKAKEYLEKLEMHLDTLKRIAEEDGIETPTPLFDENITEITETDKFVSML